MLDRRPMLLPNISPMERLAVAGGAAALLYTLARGGHRRSPWTAGAAGYLLFRSLSGWCPVYAALGVDRRDTRQALAGSRGTHIRESVLVHRPVEEVYRFWRDFRNLGHFLRHVDEVQFIDDRRSHWVVQYAGMRFEWDASIVRDVENRLIGWRSIGNADVVNAGSVQFRPAPYGLGTDVRVHLQYAPPGGSAAAAVARWLGADPSAKVREDLLRLKRYLESGASVTTNDAAAEATGSETAPF